ncbi:tripartite-type tricarboxylate transporter receptor subunit TctC [Jezberella montanilacus]|uniref:Tripartite-type tricarboxylate transporter receptor subunit TctC n=2 Tax=Jezberella montanilacus TaxID=323426 RepID=A0A2T0XKX0_9BURK|nr:tripartite-type tricarboxylate transporter receptor subunit TctC [Jezberella montanilacus]
MKKTMRHLSNLLISIGITIGCATAIAESKWPERPIKLLVGYSAGGPVDTTARLFAKYLGDELKSSVVVENKAGASGMIAADQTAKATPDGYILNFVASPSMTITPVVQRSKMFNPRTDFTLIGSVVNYTNMLVIGPQIPANSIQELIDYAKLNPDKVSFGSAGIGASNHMSAELLRQSTGTEMLHVPYKGNSPAMMDVVSGKITFMFDIISTAKVFVDSGQGRALAVTSRSRNPGMPNVPTMIESGIKDYEVVGWIGLIGPLNMPDAVVAQLREATNKVRSNPDFIAAVEKGGYAVDTINEIQFGERIAHELDLWQEVVTKGNIRPE